jgi:hypothetical protein
LRESGLEGWKAKRTGKGRENKRVRRHDGKRAKSFDGKREQTMGGKKEGRQRERQSTKDKDGRGQRVYLSAENFEYCLQM